MSEEIPRSIFKTLSPEELDAVEVPTEEEFKKALRAAQAQFLKSINNHARYPRYK
jgi:hypothetical protein